MAAVRHRHEVRAKVRARAGDQCEICAIALTYGDQLADDAASMHHRFPRRAGGIDSVSCLLLVCRHCHVRVIHRDEERAQAEGWICLDRTTSAWPVRTHQGWMYLAEDGHYQLLLQAQTVTDTSHCASSPDPVAV